MTPDLVHGAWRRRSVSIDGSGPFESQRVVWIQAGTCYADLRIPFTPGAAERCFSGRSGWDGDGYAYRWRHRLDLENSGGEPSAAAEDVGELSWEDGALVERGLFPTPTGSVCYEEIWERLPGSDGPFVALEARDTCLVRTGRHALTVVDGRPNGHPFSACYCVFVEGRWQATAFLGDGGGLPEPDNPPAAWTVVHRGTAEAVPA